MTSGDIGVVADAGLRVHRGRPRLERRAGAAGMATAHAHTVPTRMTTARARRGGDPGPAGVKGITVYRHGSRPEQVLRFLADAGSSPPLLAGPEYAGGCAGHVCEF